MRRRQIEAERAKERQKETEHLGNGNLCEYFDKEAEDSKRKESSKKRQRGRPKGT